MQICACPSLFYPVLICFLFSKTCSNLYFPVYNIKQVYY